ncbi:MAG: PAS domain S-box protein [Chitinophagaceae bacterium]|nr:PAS domain S-box protein [Chitinophagaceae bacterium]
MKGRYSIYITVIIYIVLAMLWFYVADVYLFKTLKENSGEIFWEKEIEDLISVLFTGALLYFLIRRYRKLWIKNEQETNQKEAELIQEHLDRFNKVTSVTNDVLWDWDVHTDSVWRNENYEKIFGYTSEDMRPGTSDDWLKFVHPLDQQRVQAILDEAFAGNRNSVETEYRFITKSGEVLDVLDRAFIYRDETGKPVRMVGSMQNITDLRSSQKSLEASEEHYRQIVETAHEGIWQIDEKGYTTFVNPATANMLGYTKEEMLGRMMLDFLFPEDVEAAKGRMKLHLYGVKQLFEFRLKKKSGEELWALVKGSILYDGTVYRGSIGMITDITALKASTKLLEDSEENYRLLFSQNPLPMWVYNTATYEFLAVNETALSHYGYTKEEFLNLKVTEIRPVDELVRFLDHNKSTSKEIRNAGIWKHVRKNGEMIDVEIRVQSINYNNHDAKLVLINDITDKLKAENELKKSYEQIKQLASHLQEVREEERKRIAREIHDELGQHLTALKMNVSWLDKRADNADESIKSKMKQTINIINESNLAIRKILNELRTDFVSRTSISETMETQCLQLHQQTGITVHHNIEKLNFDIDVAVSTCLYRSLQEAFTNIIRYADADTVWVGLRTEKGYIILNIKDDGIGFDPEKINTHSFGLLGIRERANDLFGVFELYSEPGKGTSLHLKIPLNKPTVTDNTEKNETHYSSR